MKASLHKTLVLKLKKPTKLKMALLLNELKEFQKAIGYSLNVIRKEDIVNIKEATDRLYKTRDIFKIANLYSATYQCAYKRALKLYKINAKQLNTQPLLLRKDTLKITKSTKGNLLAKIPIYDLHGGICLPFDCSNKHKELLEELFNRENVTVGDSKLLYTNKSFFLHLTIEKEVEIPDKIDKKYKPLGIDLGLNNLATAVLLQGYKTTSMFFDGGRANHKRELFSLVRQQLMKNKKLRKVKEMKGRESLYMKDLNHKISSEIIQLAKHADKPVIVMENLTNIRSKIKYTRKMNRRLHNWNFAQLQNFIDYKAKWEGIPVAYISPKNTSRKCRKCSHIDRNNRYGIHFKCKQCSFEDNADLNASFNIGLSVADTLNSTGHYDMAHMQGSDYNARTTL